jgi:hypothetical protein
MTRSRNWLVAPLALALLLGGCREEAADRSPQAADDRNRLLALMPDQPAFECNDIKVFIPMPQERHSVEGQKCEDNKAVINGWSRKCVAEGQCDTPARLAEVNKAAEDFCASWCAAKKCDYIYKKHDKCDLGADCYDSEDCRKNCDTPKRDCCYFIQAAPNFNCECRVKVQP